MKDRDEKPDREEADKPMTARDPTKPARQEVGPPGERVDDEVGSDDGKTTKRHE